MNWIKYIWILIVVYIVCSARTCNETEEATEKQKEEYTVNLINSVKDVFSSDSLSENLLRAFELSASEKLIDFTDYLKIASDTSLDLNFRLHAAGMIREFFIKGGIEIKDFFKNQLKPKPATLEDLLSLSLSGKVAYWIKPLQININDPLTRVNDSTYIGSLSFNFKYISIKNPDAKEMISEDHFIEIFLIKNLNTFGKENLETWQTYLGEMI